MYTLKDPIIKNTRRIISCELVLNRMKNYLSHIFYFYVILVNIFFFIAVIQQYYDVYYTSDYSQSSSFLSVKIQ